MYVAYQDDQDGVVISDVAVNSFRPDDWRHRRRIHRSSDCEYDDFAIVSHVYVDVLYNPALVFSPRY